jgi:N-acetylmuramoyl-L-alanine amidase
MMRTILLIFLIFILAASSFSQGSIVTLQSKNGKTGDVRGGERKGIIYVSLNDFAALFSFPSIHFQSTHKLEVSTAAHRLKVTQYNRFVVVTDTGSKAQHIIQLTLPVVGRDVEFFMPLEDLSRLLNKFENDSLWALKVEKKKGLPDHVNAPPPSKFSIKGLEIRSFANGALLTILANKRLGDFECNLRDDGWLFFTITNAMVDTLVFQNLQPVYPVEKIVPFQYPGSVQLTLKVSRNVERAVPARDTGSFNILLSLYLKDPRKKAVKTPHKPDLAKERTKWDLDIIVLDAGHGGIDAGTIGVRGTKEKDITLGVTLALGELIQNNLRDVEVVYTRKNDEFVELYRRPQIANEVGGKLFLSIHCNSTEKKSTAQNGFEIYLLRPGKTESALATAERENAVIRLEEGYEERYKKMTEENFILAAMAQHTFVKYSEEFAEIAAATMSKELKLRNSGVRQAGFYVLVGASMPNALIEIGYISNKKEEQYLRSESGQRKIAAALFKSILQYKEAYERSLE